jgi:uncharacterized protein YbjT (DUF2867 family)
MVTGTVRRLARDMNTDHRDNDITLVIGGTGKTGRRVAERLAAAGRPVRVGSRSGRPAFDWDDETTWFPALRGVRAAYLTYAPDLGLPGAAERVRDFTEAAYSRGVRRLVLLSGRGQHGHAPAERAVQESGAQWTIVRSAWFAQNFSEGFLAGMVADGMLALPAGEAAEPFVDAGDLADVAAAALTGDRHHGQIYEVTGPRLLRFANAAEELSRATGRPVRYLPVSDRDFAVGMTGAGVPGELVTVLGEVFAELRDGRNASTADDVRQVLGRPPRHFAEFARDAAAAGAWSVPTAARG